ncbi:MAG: phosphopentomutase [Oscillospiraceae bacterium]
MARFTIIVLDSLGVGELPDAQAFDDVGASTLSHIWESCGGLKIPNLINLGLGNIPGAGVDKCESPKASFGKAKEKSNAKDTTSGHFEIAGLVMDSPPCSFGEHFPDRIINELERLIGTKVIGNYPASGTEIIKVLGDEHVKTGFPIVYLSADSLMQIAMHEEIIPLERQYEICAIARKLMRGDDSVSRIICRPFLGESGNYYRTENRRDYSIDPPGETLLDFLKEKGKEVLAVGKIEDIFNRRGITKVNHSKNNVDGIEATIDFLKTRFDGLLFTNLVDFDMLYGHRRNARGYGDAIEYFDSKLPEIIENLQEDDILLLTADHGCDPCFKGTDHTREHIPLLVYGKKLKEGVNLGVRESFTDIAATVADYFDYAFPTGTSFLGEIRN